MVKIRRLFRAVFFLTLLFNLILPICAEAEEIEFFMTGPTDAEVFHGGTVTVLIQPDVAFRTHGMGMTIAYDADILAPLLEECTVPEGVDLSGPMTVEGRTVLRISVFPDVNSGHILETGEPAAELKFKALNPTQEVTTVEMAAVYIYGQDLDDISVKAAENVRFQVKPIPVESVTLDREELILELGDAVRLTATVLPENASDKTVTWTSSDAEKVKVVNGYLEARKVTIDGPVTITAVAGDGQCMAQCTVQVVTPPDEDYVVSVPKTTKTDTVNDEVVIPVTVANAREDIQIFNAFDITLTYDPEELEYVPADAAEGLRVEKGEGVLRFLGWGEPKNMNHCEADAFTVTFKPRKIGNSYVTVERARVDYSANAALSNASKATLQPEYDDETVSYRTAVIIAGYKVTADEGLVGVEAYVANGDSDFVFTLKDYAHYDYVYYVTIGGADKTDEIHLDAESGVCTIPQERINGEIRITAERTPKCYQVTIITDTETQYDEAEYNTDYVFSAEPGYSAEVLIGEEEYLVEPDAEGNYTISGTHITDDIEIYITKNSVDDDGSGESDDFDDYEDSEDSEDSDDYEDTEDSDDSDDYEDSGDSDESDASEDSEDSDDYDDYDDSVSSGNSDRSGTITNQNTAANRTTANSTSADNVREDALEVTEYITLNEQNLYLIVYKFNTSGKVPKYDGQSMYWSKAYNAYVWLITSEQTDAELEAAVLKKITIAAGRAAGETDCSGDVNMSRSKDLSDAKLVWQMYQAQYSLENMEMQKLLNADVTADRKLDIRDVVATAKRIS